jgi:hypothetical protein
VTYKMETEKTDFVGDWVSKDVAIPHRTTTTGRFIVFCILASFFFKGNNEIITLPVFVPLRRLNQVTEFHEIWYERYALGGHSHLASVNFLLSVIT